MKQITNFFAVILFVTIAILVAGCGKEEKESEYINYKPEDKANYNTDDWVDLGLPSGLLWATRNVGASSPEDYGDFFAWGETTSKSIYGWSTYQYSSDYNKLTKYCTNSEHGYNGFIDNLTTLTYDDDAATAHYGGRTPTKSEWVELLNNTTSQWTSINGLNGRIFIGSNGKTLFLPAAGYRSYYETIGVGDCGFYWSSSLDDGYLSYAGGLYFSLEGVIYGSGERCDGSTVRAVMDVQ